MKKIATLAAVASVAAAMIAPIQASAESAQLRITGTIVPAACRPAFAGGGVIDYGTILASTLNPTAQTTLPDKSTQLTLTCDAPALFGFKVIDERAATADISLETIPNYLPNMKFGLGTADGKKIGAYSLQMTSQTSDAGPAHPIGSYDGGATWVALGTGGMGGNGNRLVAFANSATEYVPSAHTSITADIRVVTAIEPGSDLPLTRNIPLDGLSTFEVLYL